jgi:transcriptional regulator with XRE-family HTH domain
MDEGDGRNPVVRRRRLRSDLRRARREAGLTQEQVAAEMDWSLSKIIRIENGSVGISTNDLRAVLALYGVTDAEQISSLVELARAAKERSWWDQYSNVASAPFLELVQYEASAYICRSYEPQLIPGPLQTEEYAREVLRNAFEEMEGDADDERIDQLTDDAVTLRMRRQQMLERASPTQYQSIIDESALRRLVGGPSIMREQLIKLAEMSERPNIAVEVVPFSAGIHPYLTAPFLILEFSDPADADILYLERLGGDLIYRDDVAEIVRYRGAFGKLRKLSLGRRSTAFIRQLAESLVSNAPDPQA